MQTQKHCSRICLEGMEFHAYHGVFSEEKEKGGTYLVDLCFDADTRQAEESDSLDDTVDYTKLLKLINDEMKQHADLIEHLAGRIMKNIRKSFPGISSVELRIKKLHPPVDGNMHAFTVIRKGE